MSRLHAPATYSILEMKILQVVIRDSIVPHCGWIQPKLLPACKVLNNGPPHFWHFELNVVSMICSCVYAGSYKNKILLAHLYNLLPCVHVYCDYFLKCCQIYQKIYIYKVYENVTTHEKRDHLPHIFEFKIIVAIYYKL